MTHPSVTTSRARTLFTPLDTGGRAETVARRLIQAISLGLLLDGERLPTESDLADQFGVSPVTLREALATLRTIGLVETRRGRHGGSFVCSPGDARRAELERPLKLLSLHDLRDIGDHRAAIAGAAAKLAAERAVSEDLVTLREYAGRLPGSGTLTLRRRADARIHVEIAAVAQSPRLTREEMDLWSEVGDLLWLPVTDDQLTVVIAEHEALIDAIESQRPETARLIAEQHVQAETARLLRLRLRLAAE